jgi:hypothetical protein
MAPRPPQARRQKYFPLDVLLIGLEDVHSRSLSDGLFARLAGSPSVRACAMTCEEAEAAAWIREGHVNTMLVNPMSPGWNVAGFIERVRMGFPNIIVVLCAPLTELETFLECCPGFSHYARLPLSEDIAAIEPREESGGSAGLDSDEFDAAMNRCDQWHLARHEYDICLSFAGEDRAIAAAIAVRLRDGGTRVFYDDGEAAGPGGDRLSYLHDLYSVRSRYCAILVSRAYAATRWASRECIAAQTLALAERGHQYVLPIRIDDTPLNGLPNTLGRVNLASGIEYISDVLDRKLWMRGPEAKRFIGTTSQ